MSENTTVGCPGASLSELSLRAGARSYDVADWERAAAAVLRRSHALAAEDPESLVWDKLSGNTLDGISIPPMGTAATAAGLPDTGLPGQAPYTRGTRAEVPEHGWHIRPVLTDPDASVSADDGLTDLENGATSLWVVLGCGGVAVEDLDRVLERVYLDLAPIVLDCREAPVGAAEAFIAILNRAGVRAAAGSNLGADPISASLRASVEATPKCDASPHPAAQSHSDAVPLADSVSSIADLAVSHDVLGFVVDASAVHDLGGSDAQEVGYATAVGAAYLRLLTAPEGAALDVDTAASLLEFRFAATVEQFPTIAKLRAARRLWNQVCAMSGVSQAQSGQRQHAVTSRPMMTARDPWVNLLRTTVAAFAAGVGGAEAITVLPFDSALGLPAPLSRRIARNTSSLLVWESHVGKVIDPAGGAYAVEQLTDALAQAGWAELQRLERSGGVLGAIDDGSLLRRISEVAHRRDGDIAHRRRPLTGVSEFPNLNEQLPQPKPHPSGVPQVRRYGAGFEAMRDDPAEAPVFLATMGSVAAHTARATFASNLLAAGGVDTVAAGGTSGVSEVLASYDGQRVVCLAGPDSHYTAWGADLVGALRSAGAAYIVLAGSPGDTTVDGGLVDDSCALGVDALAFLGRVREELRR